MLLLLRQSRRHCRLIEGNGHGNQSAVNASSSSEASGAAISHQASVENGACPHIRSPGYSESTSPAATKPAIPKAPSSQSAFGPSISAPLQSPKADASKTFTLQFGSINPGLMNGLQIPARTSSAPPNLDEQNRDQAHTKSMGATPSISVSSAPKPQKHLANRKAGDVHQSSSEEFISVPQIKRDASVSVPSAPVVPVPTSSGLPITGMPLPMHTQFQPQKTHVLPKFGVPSVQMHRPGLAANSLQMPMTLPMGNNPPVPQQILVPSIQTHFVQQQAMMHQGQPLGFVRPIGQLLPPQLGSMGIGITTQFAQQPGTYGGPRKTTVKITHPDTHEELRLDKNTDLSKDGDASGQRPHPNVIPQPHPSLSYPHQTKFSPIQQNSYNQSQRIFPTSVPPGSGQMPTNSQTPRYNYPLNQIGPNLNFLNSSAINNIPSGKSSSTALHDITEGFQLDALSISASLPSAVQVTMKPFVGLQSVKAGTPLSSPSVVITKPSTKVEPPMPVKTSADETTLNQKRTQTNPGGPGQQLKLISRSSTSISVPVTNTTTTTPVTLSEASLSPETPNRGSGSVLDGIDGKKTEHAQRCDNLKDNGKTSKLDASSPKGVKMSPESENMTLPDIRTTEPVVGSVMPYASVSVPEIAGKEASLDASVGNGDSSSVAPDVFSGKENLPSQTSTSLDTMVGETATYNLMTADLSVGSTGLNVRKEKRSELTEDNSLEASNDSLGDCNEAKVDSSSTIAKPSEFEKVILSKQDDKQANYLEGIFFKKEEIDKKLLNGSSSDFAELKESRTQNQENNSTDASLNSTDSETVVDCDLYAKDANADLNTFSSKLKLKSSKEDKLTDCSGAHNETAPASIPTVSMEHKRDLKVDLPNDRLTSSTILGQKNKPLLDTMKPKITAGKKKNRREMFSKADAACTFDLYTAYKGPEVKNEVAVKSESLNSPTAAANITPIGCPTKDVVSSDEDMQNKAESDDWENVADISTPKLKTPKHGQHAGEVRKQHDSNVCEATTWKKYTRDFLMKLSQHFTQLPLDFDTRSNISDVLSVSPQGKSPLPSPGKNSDRPSSRGDRRAVGPLDDDKWIKSHAHAHYGFDGNAAINLRPGQGGSHVVARNLPWQASNQSGGILSGSMQSQASQGGTRRGNLDPGDRWQLTRGLIPSPQTPLPVMHRAEKKYEIGKVSDEEEAKQRQLKGILNKLTPQNFEKLFAQVVEVNIDNLVTLTGVISQIFDKALMEPTFCEMYANFCFHLASALPDFNEANEKITFKRLLLNKCQEEFERGEREQAEANNVEDEGEVKQSKEEKEQKRLQARRRMLGNIRLIGELYKKRMLTERIMHECIKKLLGQYQNPDEEDIEALCKLMSTIGEMIDHSKAKEHMDAYFDMMATLSTNQQLSSRVRFMLRDAIDLRKNKWQQRRKVEGPKKIDEVHRDAAQERQAQSSRLYRGPVINSVTRHGQAADYGSRGSAPLSSPSPQQVGGHRALPSQARGYGIQDARLEDRHQFEGRTASLPLQHRSTDDDSITLGPQGGLARGMSIRGHSSILNVSSEISPNIEHHRVPSCTNNTIYTAGRSTRATYDQLSPQDHNNQYGSRDGKISDRTFERSSTSNLPGGQLHGTSNSSLAAVSGTKTLSEEVLREKSISAIREFYSAKDEKEVALCIKELNAPSFYPTMVTVWITDSFERNNVERELLVKLIINLYKSRDCLLNQSQLLQGFESVLASLEDAVNDAPRAPEFLGRIFAKIILEDVMALSDVGRLILQGGEEPGQLREVGLAAELLGNILETLKLERGLSITNEIRVSSNLQLDDFLPPSPLKAKKLEPFL
ncbi:eukaryotic translation initiation factor 4G-like isoform X2 [Curcuma longa]|uniref:eukaryotic translation initiation factor 4G-like isoform X2 n=1 Tax=Curcuma longa TaxID=136217 RepID=UPI003D9EA8B1